MAKTHYMYKKRKKRLSDFDTPTAVSEYISKNRARLLLFEEEETEEYDYIDYTEYIQLVFPPGSKPPTRNSKINLLDFGQIHNNLY